MFENPHYMFENPLYPEPRLKMKLETVLLPEADFKVDYNGTHILMRFIGVLNIDNGSGSQVKGAVWQGGGLKVLASKDDTHHGQLLHLSISHKHRYPTWDEIAGVRYGLISDDVDMVMLLPRQSDFVAVHPNCFHLWQAPGEWGIQ